MSRVGKYPVEVPAGVQVSLQGRQLVAKGKLGELRLDLTDHVEATVDSSVASEPLSPSSWPSHPNPAGTRPCDQAVSAQ